MTARGGGARGRGDDVRGGGSAREASSDSGVVHLLERHGASRGVAETIASVGRALATRTRCTDREYGATFDLESGAAVGGILVGSGADVAVSPHAGLLRPDQSSVALHTHPRSTPPSENDLGVLLDQPHLAMLAVAGVDGTWYVLSREPTGQVPEKQAALQAFAAAYVVLRPRYERRARTGTMTEREALTAMLHHLWRLAAPRLGLRYDRVRGTGP